MKTPAINMVSPINWLHPLNAGLMVRLQCLPGLMSGSRLVDLCGTNYLNFSGAPAWNGLVAPRPGGFGSLAFDASNDYVTGRAPTPQAVRTISFWWRLPAAIGGNTVILVQGDDAFNDAVWDWGLYSTSTPTLTVEFQGEGSHPVVTPSLTAYLGTWLHIVVVRKDFDDMGRVYFNGAFNSITSTPIGTLTNTRVVRTRTASQLMTGSFDDIRLWSVPLQASQIADLHRLSKGPLDPTLNCVDLPPYLAALAGGGFSTWWAIRRSQTIGGGTL